jgi:hypothetical protein
MIHAYLIAHMLDELVDDYLEGMSEWVKIKERHIK